MFLILGAFLFLSVLRYSILGLCEEIKIEFSAERGSFSTPNYPFAYSNNVTCRWTINSRVGSAIQLNFTDFYVEPNKKCLYDYVIIGDDDVSWSSRICGEDIPASYLSKANRLIVLFISDMNNSFRGFHAVWRAITLVNKKNNVLENKELQPSSTSMICSTANTITRTYCPSSTQEISSSRATPCLCSHFSSVYPSVEGLLQNSNANNLVATIYVTSSFRTAHVKNRTRLKALSSVSARLAKCIYSLPYDERGWHPGRKRVTLILGILIAIFAVFNIILIFMWLQCHRSRHRSSTKSTPKTELIDRIVFLPNLNAIKSNHFPEDKNLAMYIQGFTDDDDQSEK